MVTKRGSGDDGGREWMSEAKFSYVNIIDD
jgi:hypothetical protein